MNRRKFFAFLGINSIAAIVYPKLARVDESQDSKRLDMDWYRMEHSLPPDVNVHNFSVAWIKGKSYRPNIEHLNVGDYVDLTEVGAYKEGLSKFGAGRYRRIA